MIEDAGFHVIHTAIIPDEQAEIKNAHLLRRRAPRKPDSHDRRHGPFSARCDAGSHACRAGPRNPRNPRCDVGREPQGYAARHAHPAAVAGTRGTSLIINLPGSEKAAKENLSAIIGVLEHAMHMIAAEGH